MVQAINEQDYSSRDAVAPIAFCALLKLKPSLGELGRFYYRDVHGVLGARAAGLHHQYFQHHLGRCNGDLWQRLPSIDYHCSEEDQFDVVAEPTFVSEEHLVRYGESRVNALLYRDELYFVDRSAGYRTKSGNSRTLIDCTEDGAYSGPQQLTKLMCCLSKQPEVELNTFQTYLSERLAPAWCASGYVFKLRLHLFEPYNEKLWDSPGVAHDYPPERQYQALIEIGFRDNAHLHRFFDSETYTATTEEQPQQIARFNVFPEREIYTLVYDGKPTLDGVRGPSVGKIIRQVGATARMEEDEVSFYYRHTNEWSS